MKMAKNVVATTVAVVFLIMGAALVHADDNVRAIKPVMVMSGIDSSAEKRSFARCTNLDDLKEKWRIHRKLAANDECTSCPAVDFDSYEMVVIFEGKSDPNSGIRIVEVLEKYNQVRIRYEVMYYQTSITDLTEDGRTITPVKSDPRPYAFILLTATRKEILLEENICLTIGAPPKWMKTATLPASVER